MPVRSCGSCGGEGAAAALPLPPLCAANGSDNSASANVTKLTGIRMGKLLALVDVSSGWDHFLAVGYDGLRPVHNPDRSTSLRGKYTQGDFISRHKHLSGPSLSGEDAGRIQFSRPVDNVPPYILHVEIELRVEISPREFRYSAL